MTDPSLVAQCPRPKRIGFALESQGEEAPVPFASRVMHTFSFGADDPGVPHTLDLFGTVVWIDASADPDATTEGHPWRDYTLDHTVTVHQTADLGFVPLLPGRQGGT
ncbi:hypothetical protein [Desulfomicrobium salsuginis]